MVKLEKFCILLPNKLFYPHNIYYYHYCRKDRFMLFICECSCCCRGCMFSNYTIKQFISSFLSLNGAMCLRMEVISYVIELFLPNILYQGDLNIPLFNLYMYTKYKSSVVQHNRAQCKRDR